MKDSIPSRRRCIIVTGGSSGIGRHCALALNERTDWRVIATVRDDMAAKTLREAGLDVVRMEMADPGSIEAGFADALRQCGGHIDALFLNAGYGQFGALETLDWSDLEAQLRTNTIAPWQLARLALPHMRRQGHGRIVFNGSVLGLCALPLRGAYCASKFALEAIADTLRLELADSGIEVATIEPGPITSRFNANAASHLRRLIDATPEGHWSDIHARLLERLDSPGPLRRFTLDPEAVYKALVHALESRRPRTHYPVTVQTRTLAMLRRLLPRRWLHWLLIEIGRKEGR